MRGLLRRQMQEPTAESGKNQGYGVGWFVDKNAQGETVVSHSGGMGGVNTLLTLVPGKRLAVAVLANSNSGLPFSISKEILEMLTPASAESEDKEKNNLRFQVPPAERAEAELLSLAGNWKGHVHTYGAAICRSHSVYTRMATYTCRSRDSWRPY